MAKTKAASKLPKGCTLDIAQQWYVEEFIENLDEALQNEDADTAEIIAERLIDMLLEFVDDDAAVERLVVRINEDRLVEYEKKVAARCSTPPERLGR